MAIGHRRSGTHQLRRRIEGFQRRPGNWRLKGLLLSLRESVDARQLGHAWPQREPTYQRDLINLGTRDAETREHELARQQYGREPISAGEVVPTDEYIRRMLINESVSELDVLWRDEILASVEAGAATRRIARAATTVTPMDAKRGTIPVHEQIPFAETNAEAANATANPQVNFTPIDYVCEKHTQSFALTDELIDQANPDVLEASIRIAGEAVENAINRQHLVNVIDNAGQDHDVGANEASVQDVLEAMENVTDNDFDPANICIMHPEFRTELADDPALGILDFSRRELDGDDRELQAAEARTRSEVSVGPELYVASDATYNGLSGENISQSNTWGWESDAEIGGVVFGRPFVHTVVYRDISVSEFEPPFTAIHDLQGGVASAITDSVQASNNAISTITQ